MRIRVLAASAALLFSAATTFLAGSGSGIDWPAGSGSPVVKAQTADGGIDWP
ncbi:hypothetical protein [Streptomyces sp. WAC 05379]|uniref:hypothetical protein n=1 Tax=Streptomyces sp. WAC 05379 TaxID=2203207 RepID=UPI00163D0411|nr:hypothetical protein [Streptomyces sp. WAC 05379]